MEFLLRIGHSVFNVRRCRDTSSTRCSEKCGSFLKKDSVFQIHFYRSTKCVSVYYVYILRLAL